MMLEGGFSLHELTRFHYFSCYFLSPGLLCSRRQNLKDEGFALVHAATGFPELKGTEGFPGSSVRKWTAEPMAARAAARPSTEAWF